MDLAVLTNFTWQAIANGVIGNATYDRLKIIFGDNFSHICNYVSRKQRNKFDSFLEKIFREDRRIRSSIIEIAKRERKTIGNIRVGNISSGGNVQVGNYNKI